ncbi:hypothetical protein BCR34DRAFT_72607 [Clohesyomyces aquaticus]|uniref:Uncharacterized protein n=1 Tax=Clohesyomyces aquaticus TaxID=1231657 RepID=A0A1Y1YYT2_9PLEO|nr:hypothetical protein BCR34DRAFT_72607 [Clohesyomyces aquaticus]
MNFVDTDYAERRDSKARRGPRKLPKGILMNDPVFDQPKFIPKAPRMYASQDRTWRAIAGHSVDLQKLPGMEFRLLSIIAAHGVDGILQPDLVKLSNQDKRSVPHRTDMLAKKGYIEKKPVHAAKMRTSLCIHKRFAHKGHYITGGDKVEDVFVNGTIVLSNFVGLLYKVLKSSGVIATRDLRRKMGISMKAWNKRATGSALIRLEESGLLRRFRARRKGSGDVWLICISALREPTEDDIKNLYFKRKNDRIRPTTNILEEDEDGDDIMRDLELEVEFDDETGDPDEDGGLGDQTRIPPQWDPTQPVTNLTFNMLDLAGGKGCNSSFLRERTVGRFWKRPVEAIMTRITDNWEESQPPHLRHLAVVRDTAVTQERKYVHYIYRTHGHFQKAVDANEASWEAVKAAQKARKNNKNTTVQETVDLDAWGFAKRNLNDFLGRHGSSSLAVCLQAIKPGRRGTQNWDNKLYEEMGDAKPGREYRPPRPSSSSVSRSEVVARMERREATRLKRIRQYALETAFQESGQVAQDDEDVYPGPAKRPRLFEKPQDRSNNARGLLTLEQRALLGLSARGPISKSVIEQIREHRRKTGDPSAIPDVIVRDENDDSFPLKVSKPVVKPLLTMEERIARGLPPKGRLKQGIEDQIREYRRQTGNPTALPDVLIQDDDRARKPKTKRVNKSPKKDSSGVKQPKLTVAIRVAYGYPAKGRLSNVQIEELRQKLATASESQTCGGTTPMGHSGSDADTPTAVVDDNIGEDDHQAPPGPANQLEVSTEKELPKESEATGTEDLVDWSPRTKRKADELDHTWERLPKRVRAEYTRNSPIPSQQRTEEPVRIPSSPVAPLTNAPSEEQQHKSSDITQKDQLEVTTVPQMTPPSVPKLSHYRNSSISIVSQPLPTPDEVGEAQNAFSVDAPAVFDPTTTSLQFVVPEATRASQTPPPTLTREIGSSKSLESGAAKTSQMPHLAVATTPKPGGRPVKPLPIEIANRVEEIVNKFTQRSKPGIYINPFMTRPTPRGRPKKALFAIFKSLRLGEFDWFTPEPVLESNAKSREKSIPKKRGRPKKARSIVSSGENVLDHQNEVLRAQPKESMPTVPAEAGPFVSEGMTLGEKQVVIENATTPFQGQTTLEINWPSDSIAAPRIEAPNPTQPQLEPPILHSSHPTWNAINVPPSLAYASPFVSEAGPGSQSAAPSAIQNETSNGQGQSPSGTLASNNADGNAADRYIPVTQNSAGDGKPILVGVQELSSNSIQRRPRTLAWPTGVRLGQGSVHHLRTKIFLDIVQHCGGVFPGNGEIFVPFYTFWEKQAPPRWNKPDRTTLNNTMKAIFQSRKLKKIQFQHANVFGEKEMKKTILALPNISTTGPEVKKLRRNMVASYPARFFPEEIREFLGEGLQWRRVPVAAKDLTIEVTETKPEQMLQQRLIASMEVRQKRAEERKRKDAEDRSAMNAQLERNLLKQRSHTRGRRLNRVRLETLIVVARNKTLRSNSTPPARLQNNPNNAQEGNAVQNVSDSDIEAQGHLNRPAAPRFEFLVNSQNDETQGIESSDTDSDYVPPRASTSTGKPRQGSASSKRKVPSGGNDQADKDGFVNVDASTFDPNYERQTVTTLLNPDVRFYRNIGTYSTEYAVERNARLDLWVAPLKSLPEIVAQGLGKPAENVVRWELEKAMLQDPTHRKFYKDVGDIMSWEEQYKSYQLRNGLPETQDVTDPFINLTVPGPHVSAPVMPLRPGVAYRRRSGKRIRDVEDDGNHGTSEEGPQTKKPCYHQLLLATNVRQSSTDTTDEEESALPSKKQRYHTLCTEPTVVERLVGLTGNPDEPIPVSKPRSTTSTWKGEKSNEKSKKNKSRAHKSVTEFDTVGKFKKLTMTLVIASSMSGENDGVDWGIVERVYGSDSSFELPKTKKLWTWLRKNMTGPLKALTSAFQDSFLDAYEKGKLDSITDIETHDWVSLVYWACKNCKSPDIPLPKDLEKLHDFFVDESSYEPYNRKDWYKKDLPIVHRERRTLDSSFHLPIHSAKASTSIQEQNALRARSWIRSNIATPQPVYDADFAHDKLEPLGEEVLKEAVKDLMKTKTIKQRKAKRLLPGRNFNFTATYAIKYKRVLELQNFMDAVEYKKTLDRAFSDVDPSKRAVRISRSASEGASMTLLSLLGEGWVRIVPRLPPINNTIDAPSPRISMWGFSTAEYSMRNLDRSQLFWDIDVVPTPTYQHGNPLLPSGDPRASPGGMWAQLPEPPLADLDDTEALLPVWSTIDGRRVIWPWWNRVLNLVLHAVTFLPGSPSETIYQQCSEGAELFEVEMVLSWLVSVNAIQKSVGIQGSPKVATYRAHQCFWASFGDELIGEADDWFGEYIKRKKTTDAAREPWRPRYNTRFSELLSAVQEKAAATSPELNPGNGTSIGRGIARVSEAIFEDSRTQYRHVKSLDLGIESNGRSSASANTVEGSQMDWQPRPSTSRKPKVSFAPLPESREIPALDEADRNGDLDADGEADAEGELDDEML